MIQTTIKKFQVYSEGHVNSNPLDYSEDYFGKLELREIEIELDEDGEPHHSWPTCNHEHSLDCYIEDKWKGRKLIDLPEDFYPEFANGYVEHGVFDTFAEAKALYEELSAGEITFNEFKNN